jgi:hypothetical protein
LSGNTGEDSFGGSTARLIVTDFFGGTGISLGGVNTNAGGAGVTRIGAGAGGGGDAAFTSAIAALGEMTWTTGCGCGELTCIAGGCTKLLFLGE